MPLFAHMYCLVTGHRFSEHVRNLSGSESAPLKRVSVWRCSTCGKARRQGGWYDVMPPAPVETLPIGDVPELPTEGANDVTTA